MRRRGGNLHTCAVSAPGRRLKTDLSCSRRPQAHALICKRGRRGTLFASPVAGTKQCSDFQSKGVFLRLRNSCLTVALVIGWGIACNAYAADVTLAWDSSRESDVTGYGVYYKAGTDGPPYTLYGYATRDELANANAPAFTVTGLQQDSNYYFAVTAYDASGDESVFSASACAHVAAVVTPCGTSAPTGSSGSTGGSVTSATGGSTSTNATGSGTGSGGGAASTSPTPTTASPSSNLTPPASSSSGGGGGGCFLKALSD